MRKVLVAEDEPVSRHLVEATLGKFGYDVVACADGSEAWDALQRDGAPELVLLDWMMPGMDGLEVCRRVREAPNSEPTYIILLTAKRDKTDVVEGLEAGADDYITKPFDETELRARVEVGARVVALQSSLADRAIQLEDSLRRVESTAAALRDRETELEDLNNSLEQQVAERTGDLTESNAKLKVEIAERTRAEEALALRARELARSNQELEQFGHIVSHELQEPLRKVQGLAELLKSKSQDALTEQGLDILERLQKAAGRMRTLVKDVLAYSLVETDGRAFAPVDLAELVSAVLSDLEVSIQQSEGRVITESLPSIQADPRQMRQLFQNLISNGLKFHALGESPLVRVYGRFLDSRGNGVAASSAGAELCELVVEDKGIGFDQKYEHRMFNLFQRLHSRGKYEGKGIGLAMCRKIVEHHRGNIKALSHPDKGAQFIVTLPVAQPNGGNASE